jgi:hypothetical protein
LFENILGLHHILRRLHHDTSDIIKRGAGRCLPAASEYIRVVRGPPGSFVIYLRPFGHLQGKFFSTDVFLMPPTSVLRRLPRSIIIAFYKGLGAGFPKTLADSV